MAAPKKRAASPKLTANKRRDLPKSSFALPGKDKDVPGAKGTYPIDTPGRARNALGKAKRFASTPQQNAIKKAVARKYPNIKIAGNTPSPPKNRTKSVTPTSKKK